MGLIEVTKSKFWGTMVQFIHESVRDFLLSAKGLQLLDSSLNQRLIGKSHSRLTSCCYSYIMMTSLESLERETAKQRDEVKNGLKKFYPFLRYAVVFILNHMEDAEMGGTSQLNLLLELQPGSKGTRRLQCVAHILTPHYGFSRDGSEVMYESAVMGFFEIFRGPLGKTKVNLDVIGGYYDTTLEAAAAKGYEKIMQLCLDHGADVNAIRGYYGTALQAAAARGHEKIMQLCLEHGADVNITGGKYGTALQAAALYGHEKIVHLCLEHGADVNITTGMFGTALPATVWSGFETIARILLEHGADVNARGRRGTALHIAREKNYISCIDLLLEYGAEDHPPIEELSDKEIDSAKAVSAEAESESESKSG